VIFDPYRVKRKLWAGSNSIDVKLSMPRGGVLVAVRCAFASGTATAAMTLDSYDQQGTVLLARLATFVGAGTGSDVNVRVNADEIETGAWTLFAEEMLRIAWTNPNSGTQTYALEVRWQEPG
jgi:hypothetical protein